MTKKELLRSCWVHYTTRLPVEDDEHQKVVLVWNYRMKKPWVLYANTAHQDYRRRLKDPTWPPKGLANIALYHDHWMEMPAPKEQNTAVMKRKK